MSSMAAEHCCMLPTTVQLLELRQVPALSQGGLFNSCHQAAQMPDSELASQKFFLQTLDPHSEAIHAAHRGKRKRKPAFASNSDYVTDRHWGAQTPQEQPEQEPVPTDRPGGKRRHDFEADERGADALLALAQLAHGEDAQAEAQQLMAAEAEREQAQAMDHDGSGQPFSACNTAAPALQDGWDMRSGSV